ARSPSVTRSTKGAGSINSSAVPIQGQAVKNELSDSASRRRQSASSAAGSPSGRSATSSPRSGAAASEIRNPAVMQPKLYHSLAELGPAWGAVLAAVGEHDYFASRAWFDNFAATCLDSGEKVLVLAAETT